MTLKKIILKSLPTKEETCAWENFNTCIKKSFLMKAQQLHNCSLPFLEQNGLLSSCSNQISLKMIKEIKLALKMNRYGNCQDVKPCNHVEYVVDKIASYPRANTRWSEIRLKFKNFIVEEIVDSYVYNYNIIFSEVGGALGVLVGFSGMTLIDYFINIVDFVSKSFHKKSY